ncbi:glutamate receptor 2.8-like [Miscanthus floridulus]|uniref:glutamate receptor 2.8-like n=1 Tax=Miscanthus floridulus TaxID=154761 RepID=UPI003459550D
MATLEEQLGEILALLSKNSKGINELKSSMSEMRTLRTEILTWKLEGDNCVHELEHVVLDLGERVERTLGSLPPQRQSQESSEGEQSGAITFPQPPPTTTIRENHFASPKEIWKCIADYDEVTNTLVEDESDSSDDVMAISAQALNGTKGSRTIKLRGYLQARLFVLAHDAEMLVDGYAWIVTDSVGNMFSTLDGNTIHSMQGVLGVRPYIPRLDKLLNFRARFLSRYKQQNPGAPEPANPNVFHLWAYDTAWAIAPALTKVGPLTLGFKSPSSQNSNNFNDLRVLGVSQDAPRLVDAIQATKFQGISGEFILVDGQRQALVFEIFNEMPYAVPFEYVPVADPNMATNLTISYTEICHQVSLKKYDAMVGDTTIIINRSLYVDFTLPYTESGVQMVVPMNKNWSTSLWVFLKPIEQMLWVAFLVVFVFMGFVIWLVAHKESRDFGGSAWRQLVNIAYFSFQALLAVPKDPKPKNKKGVPSAESFRSVRGLGKGVSDKPYPRLCNTRRPRHEPETFRSQAVFPKGSPLVADVSRAILTVTEGDSLRGVFFITIGLWAIVGIIYAVIWFRPRQEEEPVQEAVAELAVEHVYGNRDEKKSPSEQSQSTSVTLIAFLAAAGLPTPHRLATAPTLHAPLA